MNQAIKKFESYVNAGEIVDGGPLPLRFTFRELQALFHEGRIYESNNQFLAVVE